MVNAQHAVVVVLGLVWKVQASTFLEGDIVPTSRRAQYHGSRTNFHDVIGHFCPRFGVDRLVAMPLPRPMGYVTADEYKIMLSFDHDRQLTAWLPVVSKRVKYVPMLDVIITKSGGQIVKVTAKVRPVPEHYLSERPQLQQEFTQDNHWPKHLLVYYTWETRNEVDPDRGLYVLLLAGLSVLGGLLVSVVGTFRDKLARFVEDITMDDDVGRNGAGGPSVAPYGAPPSFLPNAPQHQVMRHGSLAPPGGPSMGMPYPRPPAFAPPTGPKAD